MTDVGRRAARDRNRLAAQCLVRNDKLPAGYSLLHTVVILREGWELDNRMWIVTGPDGPFTATTDHGTLEIPAKESLDQLIAQHRYALTTLLEADRMMRALGLKNG